MKLKIIQSMLSVLLILLAVYLFIGLFAYFGADNVIFQPQPIDFKDDDSIIKLTTPNGEKISAKLFRNEKADFTILYSHGNAEDIFTLSPFFEELSKLGFNVLAYDYRGYGTSEGKPTENNAYQDIEAAYNYLVNEQNIAPEKIIIHGRSLGGAVSIDLASRKKCGGVIIESSFFSAFKVWTRFKFYPFDKFSGIDKIVRIKCPILFIHGAKDDLIPVLHSETMFEKANEPKFLYLVENANHNDLVAIAGKKYPQEILKFANYLKSSP